MKLHAITLAAAALLAAGTAQAVVFNGTTAGGPTFNRPVSLTSLSAVGTAVAYSTYEFTVTAAGSYNFQVNTTGAYDPFVLLYSPSFNAASPLANVKALNDDFPAGNLNQSAFSFALTTSTTYLFITTGFDNTDFGAFTASITGPGDVVAVPEPATYGLLALGLAVVGATARRRHAQR